MNGTVTHITVCRPPTGRLDLLVVGDANPDLVLRGDVVPRFGSGRAAARRRRPHPGRVGRDRRRRGRRLGLRTALVARVGADVFGEHVLACAARREVDVTRVAVDPTARTGLSVILSGAEDRLDPHPPGAIPTAPAGRRRRRDPRGRTARARRVVLPPADAGRRAAGPARAGSRRRLHGVARHELGPGRALGGARPTCCRSSTCSSRTPPSCWRSLGSTRRRGRRPGARASYVRGLGPLVAHEERRSRALGWGPEGVDRRRRASPSTWSTPPARVTASTPDSCGPGWTGDSFEDCLRAAAVAGSLSARADGGTAAQATAEELDR